MKAQETTQYKFMNVAPINDAILNYSKDTIEKIISEDFSVFDKDGNNIEFNDSMFHDYFKLKLDATKKTYSIESRKSIDLKIEITNYFKKVEVKLYNKNLTIQSNIYNNVLSFLDYLEIAKDEPQHHFNNVFFTTKEAENTFFEIFKTLDKQFRGVSYLVRIMERDGLVHHKKSNEWFDLLNEQMKPIESEKWAKKGQLLSASEHIETKSLRTEYLFFNPTAKPLYL